MTPNDLIQLAEHIKNLHANHITNVSEELCQKIWDKITEEVEQPLDLDALNEKHHTGYKAGHKAALRSAGHIICGLIKEFAEERTDPNVPLSKS